MTVTHRWQLLAIIAGISLLLYLLGPVLTPFAVAALLAYMGDPLVDRLHQKHRRYACIRPAFGHGVLRAQAAQDGIFTCSDCIGVGG